MIYNAAVVAITLLIAYWWAHEGLFSAVLHFICVVLAGAIALAVWEPLTIGYLIKGGGFDDYAWGVGLGVPFLVSLVVLRVMCDKLIPGNLNFPSWANWVFGGIVGLGSGILTTGILLIAVGFTQSHVELLGFVGWARNQESAGAPGKNNAQWLPVATWTDSFYRFLSRGSLVPGGKDSLANTYPDLSRMALSLHRDTYLDGACKTSAWPDAVQIVQVVQDPTMTAGSSQGAIGVVVQFNSEAFDQGATLTLGSGQVRLLKRGTAKQKPIVEFPTGFVSGSGAGVRTVAFDDLNNYCSSVSGESSTTVCILFPAASFAGNPDFIEIKGSRFPLATPVDVPGGIVSVFGGTPNRISEERLALLANAPRIPAAQLRVDDAMEITLTKNEIGNQIMVVPRDDINFLGDGYAEFATGENRSSGKTLRVQRILTKPGTLLVKLDVTRGSAVVDLDKLRKDLRAGADAAEIRLVDRAGGVFYPIGYVRTDSKLKTFKIDSGRYLKTLSQIPAMPSSGGNSLILLFSVTEGADIVGVMVGDVVAGSADLKIVNPY